MSTTYFGFPVHVVNAPGDEESGIVYCTLPNGNAPFPGAESHGEGEKGTLEKHQRAHFDGGRDERLRLNVTCYIDDVEPQGGGCLCWPRSHTRIHRKILLPAWGQMLPLQLQYQH